MLQTITEETHISRVLVGPRYTYKIKKPVRFPFVDYSTRAKRKHFCEEEVRLNRRYSPSLYLGVVRLGNGEYAVKMRTLPSSKRLDKLLAKGKVTPGMIRRIADEIWHFHKKAERKKSKYGSPGHLHHIIEDNFKLIAKFRGKSTSRLRAYLFRFIMQHRDLLRQRIKQGYIRDLHGDLHSQNIFYHQRPYIFDCIEFNPGFRLIDCAAEISFLLMDLESRGKKNLAKLLLKVYLEKSKDAGSLSLLSFYKCHYACVKGLVRCLSHDFKQARRYFKLAEQYAAEKPYLLAVGGIIGTGKSTLAKGLAEKINAILLRTDEIRITLPGIAKITRRRFGFRKGRYSPFFIRKTYNTLFSKARKLLEDGKNVVLDASFSRKIFRQQLIRLARAIKPKFKFIETVLPNRTIIKRLKNRRGNVSDAKAWLLKPFKRSYQSPVEIPTIKVRTASNKKTVLRKALKKINGSAA